MDNDATTDAELLGAWADGDTHAGQLLFQRHFDAVYCFFVNKSADAEDLAQKTFLNCIEARDRFRGDSPFRTFLLGIARNTLLNYARGEGRRARRFDITTRTAEDLGPSPSSVLSKHRKDRRLLDALRRIPLELQILLELHYWEDMTAAQIAEVVELPMGTVKSRLRRARQLVSLQFDAGLVAGSPSDPAADHEDLDAWARRVHRSLLQD